MAELEAMACGELGPGERTYLGAASPPQVRSNYPAIARVLAEMGYDGIIGLEAFA